MTPAKPCPACGRKPECNASYLVSCRCPNCYDPSEGGNGSTLCGWGETASQAVDDWNQRVTDLEEETA
jgi:hypothetical protein